MVVHAKKMNETSHTSSTPAKPKILHMVAGAGVGGAEMFSLDAIKAMHDEGLVEQHVICRDYDHYIQAFKDRGITYDILRYNHWERLTGRAKRIITARIEQFKPDLVHSWMGRASSFVPANLKMPALGWFGGYYDLKRYKNCQYFAGCTRDIRRHLIGKSGQPDHCFTLHTFGTLEEDTPVTRAEFDIPENAPLILLLSRMHWKKGIDTLLEALKQLDGFYALLAGSGPDLEKYQKMAQDLGVADRVRFLGWRDDRQALLNLADVCVLPSRYEPFGTVIAESWFAKVPLVAAKAAGAKQYVSHDKDGLLCEIDDVDGLARELKRAGTDQDLRTSLIKRGQETYNNLFSKEVVTQSFLETYKKIITENV
ncbi:MAG: glycosyltransferase [Alphaproteobacteria bacterium]|nr:glycosyltransferase [Alphaproteobacteria bacterium]